MRYSSETSLMFVLLSEDLPRIAFYQKVKLSTQQRTACRNIVTKARAVELVDLIANVLVIVFCGGNEY
jgi:hypothetical protein